MDSKLEEQRSVIKFLLLESEKPGHIFQSLQNFFSKVYKSFKWQLLSRPPYSHDLAPCDLSLLPELKRRLTGNKYKTRAALISAVN